MEVARTIGVIILVIICLTLYLGLLAYAVVSYIFGSKGLYAIAVRRGIKNPWMAWIPVVQNWTLGCLSDQYATRKYGADPKLRIKLLIFTIITQGGSVASSFGTSFSMNISLGELGGGYSVTDLPQEGQIVLIVLLVFLVLIATAALVISVIQTVYQYKAYYNLYASCRPEKAMLFLMLAIFTPANPFLVYACRNDDAGLPPETQE